ncbi:type VII secretion-associated serine protease mycosin [Streptomyces sp. HMX112]|uniref:type VII secretion-associated serine protease mycosin n=1 Tax=Streptomyces sp. HMX112 TaxID=3390850 RepID=UPI003A808780
MRTSRARAVNSSALAAALGLALLGVAATPAHAESVRDQQWHLDAMKADEAWKISTGRGVTVALIDSGVDDTVPDLRGQVLKGADYSLLSGDENNDIDNHGTGMAALIAATGARGPGQGAYGLAPGAKILPIRVPYSQERWQQENRVKESFAQSMAKAIRFAADSDARIINISVASRKNGPELAEAVTYALGKNKLVFAGVGNTADSDNAVHYPAATPGVVGVGGVNSKAAWWPKSQTGPQVDVAAPAEGIVKACSGGTQVCKGDGTSNATALTSAFAALLWSKHPEWTNNQVLRVMLNTAGKPKNGATRTDYIGYGTIRPRLALKSPGDPGPAHEYPLPDLAAAAAGRPSPAASRAAGGGAAGEERKPVAAAPVADAGGPGTGLWIGLGVAAAAVLGAAVAVPALRARRR